jgi:PAS domain-containing protein
MRRTLLVVTSLALALSLGLGALALAHLRLRISQKGRAAAEAKLHKLNLELEERIRGRTTELETANARLAVDIANREQAEKALKESEERLRTVVETLQEMVWVGEPGNPRPLYVSPVFEKIWGRPVREVMEDPAAALDLGPRLPGQGRAGPGRASARDRLGCDRAPAPGAAVASGPKDGSHRHFGRRDCP